MARVLAVEDDQVIRELLAINLRLEGYEVETAVDGRDALDQVRPRPPDLILLDVMMPEVNGLEVLAQLRRSEETRDIPVILLSARAMPSDVEQGLALGAQRYVTKPFDPVDLMEMVQTLLEEQPSS